MTTLVAAVAALVGAVIGALVARRSSREANELLAQQVAMLEESAEREYARFVTQHTEDLHLLQRERVEAPVKEEWQNELASQGLSDDDLWGACARLNRGFEEAAKLSTRILPGTLSAIDELRGEIRGTIQAAQEGIQERLNALRTNSQSAALPQGSNIVSSTPLSRPR